MNTRADMLAKTNPSAATRLQKRKQKGVTLVELSVAVAVMGLIMAGALVGVPKLMMSLKTTQTITELQKIMTNVHGAFGTGELTGSNASGTAETIARSQIFDDLPVGTAANTFKNKFGGVVTGETGVVDAAVQTGVKFSYSNVPTDACMKLIPQVKDSFTTIEANGTTVKAYGAGYAPAELAAACGRPATPSATVNNANVVTVTFGISQ